MTRSWWQVNRWDLIMYSCKNIWCSLKILFPNKIYWIIFSWIDILCHSECHALIIQVFLFSLTQRLLLSSHMCFSSLWPSVAWSPLTTILLSLTQRLLHSSHMYFSSLWPSVSLLSDPASLALLTHVFLFPLIQRLLISSYNASLLSDPASLSLFSEVFLKRCGP